MRIQTRIRSLLRTLFRKETLDADLAEELDSYLAMLVEEKLRAGMTPHEARRRARLELGGVEQVKTGVRERRVGALIETIIQDVRFAFRQFARNPGFSAVAVLTLALGIGANTAVFSVVSRVLLRPLPYPDDESVVTVWNTHVEGQLALSENEFLEYEGLDAPFESLGAYRFGPLTLSGEGEAERLPGVYASAGALRALGVTPLAGRVFGPDDDLPGTALVILLSEPMWERRFGREPEVVGRIITLNGLARTVVGVVPAGFRLPGGFTGPAPDVIAPLGLDRAAPDTRNIHYLRGVARLRRGVTLGQARGALAAAAARISERLGTLPETFSATAIPVREDVVGSARTGLMILLGAVGLVLLVACVNIANLLLARSDTRIREMAVRVSLGAGRGRLIRQLCTETGVLALAGGAAGLAVGVLGARALVAMSPPGLPRLDGVSAEPAVFGFCLFATVSTGLIIGLLPALRLSREEPVGALKGAGTGMRRGTGQAGAQTRRGLVTAQVSLAAMLSIGAGLLVRSFGELRAVDPGFDDVGVLTLQLSLPSTSYPDHPATRAFFDRLLVDVSALPGVDAVAGTTSLPLASGVGDWGVRIRGRGPDGLGEQGPVPDWIVVTPRYFEAMRIPLVEGRPFTRSDVAGGFQTAVISEEFARRHWPEGDALGAQIRMSTNIDTLWRTVVGIAADVHQTSLSDAPRPAMYLPHAQFPSTTEDWVMSQLNLVVRTHRAEAAGVAAGVRSVTGAVDPNLPIANLRTMREVTRDATATQRFQGVAFGVFALMALVLVVVGVYGVTVYLVARRTREIGIRIALGASPRGVRSFVLREGLIMTALGLAIGVAGAWMLSRLLAGLLYGVTARDPLTFVVVPLALGATVLISAAIPAARAARVDPLVALRHD